MIRKIIVSKEYGGGRLDDLIALLGGGLSKGEARRIIDRGGCAVNSSMVRVASRSVKAGDMIEIGIIEPGRFQDLVLSAEELLYEDDDLIALNKPAGINSQRTPYQLKGTLEFWVTEYFRQQRINEPARVVHRLDRGTSGVMVFPKHKRAAAWLSARLHHGLADKCYLALTIDKPETIAWRVEAAIGKIASARYGIVAGGKNAVTNFRLISRTEKCSLIEAKPLTGRTHQIRVHLESCKLPIIGDQTYGGVSAARMMLHCSSLAFKNEQGREIIINAQYDQAFGSWLNSAS